MNFTIGKKIGFAFSVILFFLIAMGSTVYVLNASVQSDTQNIQIDDVPAVILYLQVLDEIGDMHSNVMEYTTGELDEVEEFNANYQEFLGFFSQLKPLESNRQSDIDKMNLIEGLVSDYVKTINEEVFNKYHPEDEIWAKQLVDDLEHKQGEELETLLDALKEQEFQEALNTSSLEEAITDDLPGVRYYLELVDEAGDMLGSLSEYVGGESDEEEEYRANSEDFARYFSLLEPLEKKPTEIRDLITINRLYTDINRTADAVFRRYHPEDRAKALKIIDTLEHDVIDRLEKIVDSSALDEQKDAEESLSRLFDTLNTINILIIILATLSVVIGGIISYWITNTILKAVGGEPHIIEGLANKVAKGDINIKVDGLNTNQTGIYAALQEMISALKIKVKMAEKTSQGDLTSDINLASDEDVLGLALNKMQQNFRDMVKQANKFATGDYTSQITPRSKTDELGIALSHMMQQVTDRNSQVESQNWMKTQVVKINKLSQEAKEKRQLAQVIINEISHILKAGYGVFYLLENDKDKKEEQFKLQASYAYTERKNISNAFSLGEGLVGQCALEQQVIILTNVPEDYIQISSGLGEQKPENIIVLPITFENKCIGVIEVASFTKFTEHEIEFLKQAMSNLGIAISSLVSRQRIENLLQRSQSQTEELQSQSEELRSANEELKEKAKALNIQSKELQLANKDLEEKSEILETKQKDIEIKNEEIEFKAKELAIASKYKSEFLANMSHELRTPLNSLLLLAKGLSNNKKGNLDPVQVEDAQVIYEGGNNLLSLINDIMDLSKVEAGKLTIHHEKISLKIIKRNLLKMFEPIAADRGLEFKIEISKNIETHFISDGLRLEQILRNLLSNAMKFTSQGKVNLTVDKPNKDIIFSHSKLNHDSTISFSVTDTGIGIPLDKQQAIFEAFQQEDGTTSRKYGGTGLGLTIARELTRLLSGEIQLKSDLGSGSTFALYLPLGSNLIEHQEEIKQSEYEINMTHIAKETSGTKQESIFIDDDRRNIHESDNVLLVIDDDEHFSKTLRDLAQRKGYKCIVAGDGRAGIYLAKEYQPKGIILDITLPDIDGYKVLEQLKFSLKTRHIPVEIISGHSDAKQKTLQQGAIGFLSKPVEEQQLIEALSNITQLGNKNISDILIIDDDEVNQKATTQLLNSKNIRIKNVGTGILGYEEIKKNKYDCIILDLGLPDMSGFEVLEKINQSDIQNLPPIIIYTGREISEQEQKQLDIYSSSIVIKGVGSAERLLDDVSLFLHHINENEAVNILHDEDELIKGRKVLLVDDDMRNSYALSKSLFEVGVDVEMATNGKEAVDILEKDSSFELVLMDTMMPVMDGNEATQLIRKMPKYKNIPIIALTAKTMPEDREKCLKSGASEYITKPVDFDDLMSIMRIWLFQHKK